VGDSPRFLPRRRSGESDRSSERLQNKKKELTTHLLVVHPSGERTKHTREKPKIQRTRCGHMRAITARPIRAGITGSNGAFMGESERSLNLNSLEEKGKAIQNFPKPRGHIYKKVLFYEMHLKECTKKDSCCGVSGILPRVGRKDGGQLHLNRTVLYAR